MWFLPRGKDSLCKENQENGTFLAKHNHGGEKLVPVRVFCTRFYIWKLSQSREINENIPWIEKKKTLLKRLRLPHVYHVIGHPVYLDIVLSQRIEINPELYLLGSKPGWILTGRTNDDNPNICESSLLILTYGNNVSKTNVFTGVDKVLPTKPEIGRLLECWRKRYHGQYYISRWRIGFTAVPRVFKIEDERYQVTWTWKEENPDLSVNKELAVGRLKSVVSKLRNQPGLLQKYNLS